MRLLPCRQLRWCSTTAGCEGLINSRSSVPRLDSCQRQDPEGDFLSGIEATHIYQLFGKKGLKTQRWPQSDSPQQDGSIGYHLLTGKHGPTEYDWKCYLNFANPRLKAM
jgi:hypothetical protein